MGKVKVVLNKSGVRNLLQSPEMQGLCLWYANNAANKLGEGYEVSTMVGKNRVNASVYAKSSKAKKENLENNTILKAVWGG